MYAIQSVFMIIWVILNFARLSQAHPPIVVADEDHCDQDLYDNGHKNTKGSYEPSFCQEVILNDTPALYMQDDYNVLAALAISVLNKTYPTRVNSKRSFAIYDEMPYPVPTGTTSYYMVLFTVVFTFYFTKFIHWLLKDVAKSIDLFPVTDHFPNVNLHMLQESRRESRLTRDVRNTWAWLATYYLLKPSDPLVDPDEVFRTGWTDFKVPQDVWGIIKQVLRVNAFEEFEQDEFGQDIENDEVEPEAKKAVSDTAILQGNKNKNSASEEAKKRLSSSVLMDDLKEKSASHESIKHEDENRKRPSSSFSNKDQPNDHSDV